eukprot:UN07832
MKMLDSVNKQEKRTVYEHVDSDIVLRGFEKAVVSWGKTKPTKLITDKCNITAKSRQDILKWANIKQRMVGVYFMTPVTVCKKRILKRKVHPTLGSKTHDK